MTPNTEEIDDVERLRQVRRGLEREFRTIDRLGTHIRRQEKKRSKNLAMGRKLLAQRGGPLSKSDANSSHAKIVKSRRTA